LLQIIQDCYQYGSVKARDAINRRLYKGLIIASLRLAACHQKTLSEPYWKPIILLYSPHCLQISHE
ncbi:MAG: hypothetical protein ACYTXF_34015, partial [Nostoc sp.]